MTEALTKINDVINDPSVQDKTKPISDSLAAQISQTAAALDNVAPSLMTPEVTSAADNAQGALTDKQIEASASILPPPLPPKASDFSSPTGTTPDCTTHTCDTTGRTEVNCA